MEVATGIDSSYFVLDVPDLGWGVVPTARLLTFEATLPDGSSRTFTEPCTADSDGSVSFRGLGSLLESYVAPVALSPSLLETSGVTLHTLSRAAFSVTLTYGAEESPSTSTLGSVAYYASRRVSQAPSGLRMWLSHYHRREIGALQPLLFGTLAYPGIGVRLRVCWLSSGHLWTTFLTPVCPSPSSSSPPTEALVVCYSLDALAALVNAVHPSGGECLASAIRLVCADLLDGVTVRDTLVFEVDPLPRRLRRLVAFTNCWGLPEVEDFWSSDERTTQLDGEYAWVSDSYRRVSTSSVTRHRLCTSYTSESHRENLLDLSVSPEVLLCSDGGSGEWRRMTVEDVDLTDLRPWSEPPVGYVTLRESDRHQCVVSRSASPLGEGIFDETFDETFE